MTSSRWREALGALAVLLGLLVAGEWATRRWLRTLATVVEDPRLGIRPESHARYVFPTEGYSVRRTNAFGFFDDDTLTRRPRRRVLLLGDSFAEGLQVPAGRTFADVAERLLPDTEILNAAHSGRYPLYYAAVLPALQRMFHPDAVVIQLNDGDLDEMGTPRRYTETMDELRRCARDTSGGAAPPRRGVLRALVHECALLKFAQDRFLLLAIQERIRWRTKWHPGSEMSEYEREGTVPPLAPALFDSLYTAMRAVNPHLVLVYVPHVLYFDRPVRVLYPLRRRYYHDFAARHGAVLVDPSDSLVSEYLRTGQPLEGFDNSLPGQGHINERGHAVVGRLLARALRQASP